MKKQLLLFCLLMLSILAGRAQQAGINWESQQTGIDRDWRAVTYGNGIYVAVANGASSTSVMTSPDGANWTLRNAFGLNWNSVTYGNGLFVAVASSGTGNRVMTSPDGINWTSRTSAADLNWQSVTYGNGLFVAVASSGTGNRVMTSPDGINWTSRTSVADNSWNGVTFGNNLFVAVASAGTINNKVMTSPDGINWTARTLPTVSGTWNSVTYGNGLFVAVAPSGIVGTRVITSPDGINWTLRSTPLDAQWWSVTYGNNLFMAVVNYGTGDQVMTSPNGINWTTRTTPFTGGFMAVTSNNNNQFVVVSNNTPGKCVIYSSNGINWTTVQTTPDLGWKSIAYGNNLFVAVAISGTGNRVMTSPDGINWTSRLSAEDNNWFSVTYGNGLFVAVAASGSGSNWIMTSPDGINWTSRTAPANSPWYSVTYGNGLFVAVASTATGTRVMTSPDGINWTGRTTSGTNNWNAVAYGNGLFVAVSNTGVGNRVMTSPDGINWTSRTSAADNSWTSVTYGNGLFVAVASTGTGNRVMTSPDGINWTIRTSAANNGWLNVTYANGLFVAVSGSGIGNRIMTSPDGINWTSRTSPADNSWQSVCYGAGKFVAVSTNGIGNRVMTSSAAPIAIPTSVNVGTSDTFTSLTNDGGLFQAMALSPLTGNTTVSITSDLTETGTYSLTKNALNGYNLTIKSSTNTTRVISCLNGAKPMITIDSADASDVTINGSINGSGQYLRFISTHSTPSSGNPVFSIKNGSRVSISNCIIESNTKSFTTFGVVNIGDGNNQVRLRTNDIRSSMGSPGTVGIPDYLIYSSSLGNKITIGGDSSQHGNRLYGFSSTGIYLFKSADSALIRYNHVYQTGNIGGSHSYIYLASGSYHNVSNNAIYQTSGNALGNMYGIIISTSSGNGHRVHFNSIGGANENRTGAAMSFDFNGERNPIFLTVSNTGFSSIQGNLISNMACPNVGTLNGIKAQGNVRIGTEVGNIIGGGTLPSDTMNTAYDNGGILIMGADTAIIENNTIGNINFWKSSSGRLGGIVSFQGAFVRIRKNTIRDLTSYSTDQGITYFPVGISLQNGAKAGSVIDSNVVYNINRQIPVTGPVNNSYVIGILSKGTATNLSIANNSIYNIRNFSTTTASDCGKAVGLLIDGTTNNNVTISNNQISLANNTGNEVAVFGILDMASGSNFPTNRFFHNTVYVGGSNNAGALPSYAFYRDALNSKVTLKNNIFFNERSGGTGTGFALGIKSSTNFDPGVSNYNALFSAQDTLRFDYLNVPYGINGFITNSLNDSNSLSLSTATHSGASLFTNISSGNLSILAAKRSLIAGKGTPISLVTSDVIGTTRSSTSPTIGAFEYATGPSVSVSGLLSSFAACAGSASSQQSFTVSGSNLTADITITAPTGFAISTSSGTGFSPSVTLTQISGSVNATTIYIRMTSSASGSPSGNVTCTSTGATSQSIAVSGTVNVIPTIALGTINSVLTTATSFTIPYSATTGSPNEYSIAAGSLGAMPNFSPVVNAALGSSPIQVTIPASTASTYNFLLVVKNSNTGCQSNPIPVSLTVGEPAPSISISGSLSAFTACAGSPADQQTFSVGGTYLTANIVVTAPAGFEVSTTSGSGFTQSLNLTPSSGTVPTTTIYTRMAASATGTPSGNITCTSNGAGQQSIAVSGTVNVVPTITFNAIIPVSDTSTSFKLTYTATTGNPNEFSISTGTPNAMTGFSAISNAPLAASPIAIPMPVSAQGDYNFNLTLKNTTTGCQSNAIPFIVAVAPPGPTLSLSASFDPFSTCQGTASSAQQFTVGGINLSGDITITAPAGFEVSSTLASGYAASLKLTPVSGIVAATTLYLRINSSAT
ncbi:MAG: hypothetical protein K1X82_14250, partial [Bacteroidia bacterium]|nr:hypothetical protein [Bacteroidia bacterium]